MRHCLPLQNKHVSCKKMRKKAAKVVACNENCKKNVRFIYYIYYTVYSHVSACARACEMHEQVCAHALSLCLWLQLVNMISAKQRKK